MVSLLSLCPNSGDPESIVIISFVSSLIFLKLLLFVAGCTTVHTDMETLDVS